MTDFSVEIAAALERLEQRISSNKEFGDLRIRRKSLRDCAPLLEEWVAFVDGCRAKSRVRVMKSPQWWTACYRRGGLQAVVEITLSHAGKKFQVSGYSHQFSFDSGGRAIVQCDLMVGRGSPFLREFFDGGDDILRNAVADRVRDRLLEIRDECVRLAEAGLLEAEAALDAAMAQGSRRSEEERKNFRDRLSKVVCSQRSDARANISDLEPAEILSVLNVEDSLKQVDSLIAFVRANSSLDGAAVALIIRLVQGGHANSLASLLNFSRTNRSLLGFADESDVEAALRLAKVRDVIDS